MFEFLF